MMKEKHVVMQYFPILTSLCAFYSRRSQVIERFECHDSVSTPEQMDTTNSSTDPAPSYSKTANQRAGRHERRLSNQKTGTNKDISVEIDV